MDNSTASKIIGDALSSVIDEHEDHEPGDILMDWVCVAFVTNPDSEEIGHSYPMFLSNGFAPSHIVRGLLETGLRMLNDPE